MLNGRQVAIGPVLPEDLSRLFAWGDDPQIARLNQPWLPKNLDREHDFWLNAGGDPRRIFMAVRRTGRAEIAGYVQITAIESIHRSANLGILIGRPEDRGRGLGREAMELTIAFCRDHLNLTRLSLAVHADNAAAIGLYERLGFATEGCLRAAQFIAGRWGWWRRAPRAPCRMWRWHDVRPPPQSTTHGLPTCAGGGPCGILPIRKMGLKLAQSPRYGGDPKARPDECRIPSRGRRRTS